MSFWHSVGMHRSVEKNNLDRHILHSVGMYPANHK
jgi:hypothetical protein